MKSKLLFSLFLGSALGLSAQGFKDGVEYYRADQPEEAAIILTNTLNQAGTDQSTRPDCIEKRRQSRCQIQFRQRYGCQPRQRV